MYIQIQFREVLVNLILICHSYIATAAVIYVGKSLMHLQIEICKIKS